METGGDESSTGEFTGHLADSWITEDSTLREAGEDWGGVVRLRPRAVARPGTTLELARDIRHAANHGIAYVARGQGHSCLGAAQVEQGLVIDTRNLHRIGSVGPEGVIVEAGATWRDVLAATLPHRLAPPVMTDFLDLSVGGTLSVGGIGGASQHHGLMVDNVLAMDVITADGERRTCSPVQNPSLFDAVRGGRGRHGIIARATVRLVPAPATVRRWKLRYTDISGLLHDQRRVVAERRFDYVEGLATAGEDGELWCLTLDAATFAQEGEQPGTPYLDDLNYQAGEAEDLGYFDFLNAMAEGEAFLRSSGGWYRPHPWINCFLPDSQTRIITETIRGFKPADVGGPEGLVLFYPFPTSAVSTQVTLPAEDMTWLFALLRTAPADTPGAVDAMLAGNEALRQRTLDGGGTLYLE